MRFKIMGLGLILLCMCCSSNPDRPPEIVSQEVNYYTGSTFARVWTAAEKSFGDIRFVIKEMIREKGLYDAEAESQPSDASPPLMSVMIVEEEGRVKVDCIVVITGSEGDSGLGRQYLDQFFSALQRNLE